MTVPNCQIETRPFFTTFLIKINACTSHFAFQLFVVHVFSPRSTAKCEVKEFMKNQAKGHSGTQLHIFHDGYDSKPSKQPYSTI